MQLKEERRSLNSKINLKTLHQIHPAAHRHIILIGRVTPTKADNLITIAAHLITADNLITTVIKTIKVIHGNCPRLNKRPFSGSNVKTYQINAHDEEQEVTDIPEMEGNDDSYDEENPNFHADEEQRETDYIFSPISKLT